MPGIKPCLWFQTEAEEAASFYVSLFPNSTISSGRAAADGWVAEQREWLVVHSYL